MDAFAALPVGFADAREDVHRLATHVLARRRFDVTGRIGLRATPGGIGTPAFGEGAEVVRLSGGSLLHERDGRTAVVSLAGASLESLAAAVGVDLDAPAALGDDAPLVGDRTRRLRVDDPSLAALAGWFACASALLDAVAAGPGRDASIAQLWPEHFDAALDVAVGMAGRANVGCSPGDGWCPEPYLYVGPWTDRRPGEPDWWNAPFGAARTYTDLAATPDPLAAGLAFVDESLRRLG